MAEPVRTGATAASDPPPSIDMAQWRRIKELAQADGRNPRGFVNEIVGLGIAAYEARTKKP